MIEAVFIVFTIVATVFTGFSSSLTEEEIRTRSTKYEFAVDQRYHDVFARILEQTRACYFDSPLWAQQTVTGERDNAMQTAVVAVTYLYGPTEKGTRFLIDIKATGDNATEVVSYYQNRQDRNEAKVVEEWVTSNSTVCST